MPRLTLPGRPAALETAWQATIDDHVSALAWSPDGGLLAAASAAGPIVLLDGTTGQTVRAWAGHDQGTLALDWHPAGRLLASAGQDGVVRRWDSTAGGEVPPLPGGSGWVEAVAWSPNGALLAAGAGKILRVWDAAGTLVHDYAGHAGTVNDLAWRPGGGPLATAAYGGVTIWDPADPEIHRRLAWTGASLALAWSPHGHYIATGDQDATVHFWTVRDGSDLMMRGYQTKVRPLSWDHSSRYLATGGNAEVLVWDCSGRGPEGTRPLVLEAHTVPLSALAFQHNGPLLASGDPDGRVALWRPEQGRKARGQAGIPAGVTHVTWSPDDGRVAVGDEAGGVTVFAV